MTGIDPTALLLSVGWPAPVAAERVLGGWDTELWRVTTPDGRAHALPVYRQRARSPRAAEREAAALRAVLAGGIPAPAVLATGVFDSRPFLILSWLRGRPMLDALPSRPWDLWRLGVALGRLQARLHTLGAPEALAAVSPELWPTIVDDEDLVAAVRQETASPTFCHGDFHPANVMMAPAGITGVIDFANAMSADRRADLGITETMLLRAPLPPDPLKPVLQQLRRVLARAWRSGYRAHSGDFPLTPLFQAWGAAYWLRGLENTVRDGRGWAGTADVAAVRRYVADRKRAAGLLERG
jgi:aminoglycoside phosphotransferase (APT) family kinase protein